jgi:hypothetical protein
MLKLKNYVGIGIRYSELERSYGATNYYDYIILEMIHVPQNYDISTVIGRCYDALKVNGKLYIDINGTSFNYDKFTIVNELFMNSVGEKDGIYILQKVKNK